MKTRDIVGQLQAEVPRHTNKFTDQVAFTSLTAVGTTVTAVTASAHGRTAGQAVSVTGVLTENPVSLIASGTTVTGTTTFAHDLTEGAGATVTISGAADSDFNGTFDLASAVNRKTFTYKLPAAPAGSAGGTPVLEEDRIDGFNGLFEITVASATSFTYEVATPPPGLAVLTNAVANIKSRISRAISLEAVAAAYTKQADTDTLWMFVVPGNTTVSNDRHQLNDSTASFMEGTERRLHTIVNFDIVVVFPSADERAGAEAADDAQDVAVVLYKALAGYHSPSGLVDGTQFQVTPVEHGFGSYNGPVYVHRYGWQAIEDITEADTFITGSRAFRDARVIMENDFDEDIIDTSVDLDDQPLS